MKNLNLLILAGAALLLGSCSNDDASLISAGNGMVTFNVAVPGSINSRAISDGTTVNDLHYVIFDENGRVVEEFEKADAFANGLNTQVQIQLVNSKTYTIAFWAQNGDAPYTFANGKVTVDYADGKKYANDESRDAFYGVYGPFTCSSTFQPESDIVLKRPFAQVNVGTADWTTVVTHQAAPTKTGMSFTATVASTLNLLDGSVGDLVAVDFDLAALPDNDGNGSTVDDLTITKADGTTAAYKWIGMNYILVPATKETVSTITFKHNYANGAIAFTQVPVQRNFRTNIVGNLLTSYTDWQIVIDQTFDKPDNNIIVWDGVTLTQVVPVTKTIDGSDVQVYEVSSSAELAYMAQTAGLKDAYIELTSDVDLGGHEWTAFGAVGRKDYQNMFTGTFDGAGFAIKNFTVEANGDEQCAAFIASADGATIKNVTLEGATVKASDTAAGLVAFIQGTTTIENCNVNVNISNIYENPGSVVIGTAVGGVVGRVYGENCVISGCTVSGTITGNSGVNAQSKIGGIVGMIGLNKAKGLTITGCTNNATMTGTSDFGFGGILGAAFKNTDVTITDCINNGNITNNYTSVTNLTGAGGILGCAQSINYNGANDNFVITNCTNNGTIKGYKTDGVGQIIGALVDATFDTATCLSNGSTEVLTNN